MNEFDRYNGKTYKPNNEESKCCFNCEQRKWCENYAPEHNDWVCLCWEREKTLDQITLNIEELL